MALTTVSSDRLSTNVKNTNFTAAEKQDLTDDILPLTGQLGNRNILHNGSFIVHQRGGTHTHAGSSSNYYGPDRFMHNCTGNGKTSIQQSTDAPNGFTNSLLITTTTQAATASSDIAYVGQYIEANNMTQLGWGASGTTTATLSFYVKSSLTDNFLQVAVTFSLFSSSYATCSSNLVLELSSSCLSDFNCIFSD